MERCAIIIKYLTFIYADKNLKKKTIHTITWNVLRQDKSQHHCCKRETPPLHVPVHRIKLTIPFYSWARQSNYCRMPLLSITKDASTFFLFTNSIRQRTVIRVSHSICVSGNGLYQNRRKETNDSTTLWQLQHCFSL